MTIKRWIALTLILGLLWLFRSFLPFMFFSHSGIEVILNVPESVKQPTVSASYVSSNCDSLSLYDLSWQNQKTRIFFETEKISATQYKVNIPYGDYSPCSWWLRSLGWSLDLKDASLMHAKVASDEGGGAGIGIKIVYQPEHWLDLYHDGVFIIDDEITPHVYFSYFYKLSLVDIPGKNILFLRSQYAHYKLEYSLPNADGHAQIIYNATINTDKLIDESE